VLAGVVLVRLHDADAGEAEVVERAVMPAAAKSVEAVDHDRIEIRQVQVGDPGNVASQLPGGPVDLAAGEAAPTSFLLGLGNRGRFRKYAEGVVGDHPVDALDVADHVVVEDAGDLPSLGVGDLGHVPAAEQALFLSGQSDVDDRRRELVLRQHPRCLDRPRHARGVVVGSGGVAGGVEAVGDPGVDIAAHDHVAVRVDRAALDRHHIDDLGVDGDPGVLVPGLDVALDHDLQTGGALLGDVGELGLDPSARGADAPS